MAVRNPIILYFTAEAAPTLEEALEVAKLPFKPHLRNAQFADEFEPCHGVLGEVPELFESYPKGYLLDGIDVGEQRIPDGDAVWKVFKKQQIAELMLLGEASKAQTEADTLRAQAVAAAQNKNGSPEHQQALADKANAAQSEANKKHGTAQGVMRKWPGLVAAASRVPLPGSDTEAE